ncbi:RNA-binding protein [Diplonema papillatum]|nr:RNA-binding protein [Diplonema papillatum]
MAAMLTKSLDELIKEKKSSQRGRGTGRGGGKTAGTKSGGRGQSAPVAARQAGGRGRQPLAAKSHARSQPYSASAFGRGRGSGGRAVVQNQVVQSKNQSRNRVFITSIPYDWDEQNILLVVETAGAVEKLTIFWDPSGRPTGNALCTYRTEQAARKAVAELNGAHLGNSTISVTSARADKGEKGGGGGKGAVAGRGAGNAGKGSKASAGKTGGKGGKTFGKTKGSGGKGGGKGAKGGAKGGKAGNTRVERKEVSKEDLDSQLTKFLTVES